MIETILIAILAKLNKTKVSMLQNKISKKFLVQRYMLLAHNKFDIHKKKSCAKSLSCLQTCHSTWYDIKLKIKWDTVRNCTEYKNLLHVSTI